MTLNQRGSKIRYIYIHVKLCRIGIISSSHPPQSSIPDPLPIWMYRGKKEIEAKLKIYKSRNPVSIEWESIRGKLKTCVTINLLKFLSYFPFHWSSFLEHKEFCSIFAPSSILKGRDEMNKRADKISKGKLPQWIQNFE